MVVILDRDESKRLQNAVIDAPHWAQDFRHPMDRPCLRLEGDFHKVTFPQRLRQAEQSTSSRNGLEFSFGAAAIFEADRS